MTHTLKLLVMERVLRFYCRSLVITCPLGMAVGTTLVVVRELDPQYKNLSTAGLCVQLSQDALFGAAYGCWSALMWPVTFPVIIYTVAKYHDKN